VTTDANGRFTARIPAGASRIVRFSYEAVTAQTTLVVPANVTAKPRRSKLRNGQQMLIRGRVAGPIPGGGVPVSLEVRDNRRWTPVATTRVRVKTARSGRFTLAYRFLGTFVPVTYRFRVVAGEDSAFPYRRGTSRTMHVHVRP
jgi:hypothetical protein